jgi:CheY-like chemotaxis protein
MRTLDGRDPHATTAPDEPEPGQRSGSGARSLWHHMEQDAQRKTLPAAQRTPSLPDRARFTVLVVDDTRAARYAMARGLRAAGYRTLEAAGGAEALQLAGSSSAVVLDMHLPDVHGLEVCRLLRADPRTTALPILHVTAIELEPHHKESALAAGADGFFVAPVNPEDLVEAIDGLVSRTPRSPTPG